MSQEILLVLSTLVGIIDILLLVLGKVLWDKIKNLETVKEKVETVTTVEERVSNLTETVDGMKDNIEELEKEMKQFRSNYLTRFEAVHKRLNEVEVSIVKEISELKIAILKGS